ncbi:MAG: recombination protein RecR [Bacilli bacterium]|nr:recombination protein RecR [Bacilli bacterium]
MNELKFLEPLIASFEKLPGVGQKTATRYAFQVVEKLSEEDIAEFAKVLIETKENIKHCSVCNMLTTSEVCDICDNEKREKDKILVVKDTKDVISLEKTRQYNGLYHVLGGLISPIDGIGPDDLNIKDLEVRCKDLSVKEVILATSLTPQGETTALYLEKILKRDDLEISRIGYGIPAGGDIEYADELTLRKALSSRIKL